jgi:hypothetical protein
MGQLTDRLELLSLTQGSLSRLAFCDFGLQVKIGRTQLESQPHSFGKEPVEASPGQRQRGRKHDNYRP